MLYSYENPRPDFVYKHLKRIRAKDFDDLKVVCNFQCTTCGVYEVNSHCYFLQKIVELEQGHKDPNLELTLDNTIPQCQLCNKFYLDRFIFDDNGGITPLNIYSNN